MSRSLPRLTTTTRSDLLIDSFRWSTCLRDESLELLLSFCFFFLAFDCMVSCISLVKLQPDPCDLISYLAFPLSFSSSRDRAFHTQKGRFPSLAEKNPAWK